MMRKYKNYKGASITIRRSQIVTMVMFNLTKKKVNGTVVLTPFYITK